MDVSLPPALKRFVEKKVKEGVYQSESDVMSDALRRLKERDHLLSRNATGASAPTSSPFATILKLGLQDGDIEALAFIVLMQATRSMDEDLKMIMAEVKAMTAAKQKLRELLCKVNKDIANNLAQREPKRPLKFSSGGMGSERAYHHAKIPFPDPNVESGVRFIQKDLHSAKIDSVEILESICDELKGKLDGMSEMSELSSLRLQMMMDRRSKLLTTLSNIMKKISSTQETLVQNLK